MDVIVGLYEYKQQSIWKDKDINILKNNICHFDNIALINDGYDTAPSRRLYNAFDTPKYNKTIHSSTIIKGIGIETIRSKCNHFNDWICKIENLSEL